MAFFKKATNTLLAIPEIETKVKEATNNEPWGPSGSQMGDIARATQNYADFSIIMNVIWKRLNDQGKYWRHVYKSLLLLDYLIKNGAPEVVREVKVHLVEIQTLTQFAHIDEKDKDVGVSVRERAKHIVDLMNDENRVKQEREKAQKNQGKWTTAISSEGYVPPSSSSSTYASPPMGSPAPASSYSASAPQSKPPARKDDSSDDEVGPPQQPGQRPVYAQADMYAAMSAAHAASAPQYPQAAAQPQYPQAAAQPQYPQAAQYPPSAYGGAAPNPYTSPNAHPGNAGGATPTTAAAAGLFGPSAGAASPQYGQPAAQQRVPQYPSPPTQPQAGGSQGSLFGNPQGGSPYGQQYGQPQQHQQQHGGFQGNYGGQSHEDLFNPRVGQPAAAASAPAPAQGNPYGVAASSQYGAQSSNPFGASVSAPSAQGTGNVTAANLGLFGMPQQQAAAAPAPAASPFAPVAAPSPASAPAPSAAPASPFAPVSAGGAAGGMQVMYTPQGQPVYVMTGAPPANAPVYVLVNGQLVPASQAGAAK